jgi:hypothetical protein
MRSIRYIPIMEHRHLPIFIGSLVINVLLSWLILPFVIPPFQGFSSADLLEVLLWQVIAALGWPFAILGGLLSQIFTRGYDNLLHLLFMLVYPVMLLLFGRALFSKSLRHWELPLLHLLLVFSFAVIWYYVLNGYDFMPG